MCLSVQNSAFLVRVFIISISLQFVASQLVASLAPSGAKDVSVPLGFGHVPKE